MVQGGMSTSPSVADASERVIPGFRCAMHHARTPIGLLLVALLFAGCQGGDENALAIQETRTTLYVGSEPVDVVLFASEEPGLTYINLHDNEQTSVDAALEVLQLSGGRVFELQHRGERNITFTLDGIVYVFDPNRMFSDIGAQVSLLRLSQYSADAQAAVRAFAEDVLALYDLPQLDTVITLHNTYEGFSVLSYASGGEYEQEAEAVFVSEGTDPNDFFFVTDVEIYDGLRAEGFNVVLQDNEQVTDDGSLSVYSADQGLPYANAEAQHGHHEEQVDMLLGLGEVLRMLNAP